MRWFSARSSVRFLLPWSVCLLFACGGGVSSSSGSSAAGTSLGGPGSATNQTHWQTALSALAFAAQPEAERVDAAALTAWNAAIARAWPHLMTAADPILRQGLTSLAGQQQS
ncbi:MAG: hypothetical protein ACYTFT_09945, partial [Planctomycetota bacterium]